MRKMMHTILAGLALVLAGCGPQAVPGGEVPATPKDPLVVKAKETPSSGWVEYSALTVDRIPGFTPGKVPETDKYGGMLSVIREASGYFRVEKIGARWWMIDPLGHPFIAASVGEFAVGGSARQQQALSSTFGTTPRWAASEMNWIKSKGFTALGRGNSNTVKDIPTRIPYCVYAGPMTSYVRHLRDDLKYNIPTNTPIVFDTGYDEYLSSLSWLTKYADDPYCIGIFADNELYWTDDLLKIYLEKLPSADVNRTAAQKWLDERKGRTGCTASDATAEDRDAFKAYCLDNYLKRTLFAIRTYDANHMFIGSRFYKWTSELASEAMMQTAGRYMDIVSVNYYTKWEPDLEALSRWESWSGREAAGPGSAIRRSIWNPRKPSRSR